MFIIIDSFLWQWCVSVSIDWLLVRVGQFCKRNKVHNFEIEMHDICILNSETQSGLSNHALILLIGKWNKTRKPSEQHKKFQFVH